MPGIIKKINSIIEQANQAAALDKPQRRELMAAQIQSIVEMSPAMAVGCFAIIAMILISATQTSVFHALIIWAFALGSVQSLGVYQWWTSRKGPKKTSVSLKAIGTASLHAGLLGAIWGLLPLIVFPSDDTNLKLVSIMALTAVFCGSGFALAVIPQAVVAFILPITAGTIIGVAFDNASFHAVNILFLLGAFLVIIPVICIRYSRSFCRHVTSEIAIRNQNNFIGLLLNEYEENASDWLWEIDEGGQTVSASNRLIQACEMDANEIDGSFLFLEYLETKTTNKSSYAAIANAIANREPFRDVELPLDLNGRAVWWQLTGKPVYNEIGGYCGFIGIGSDYTSEKTAETKINKLAHCDALTGLLNRASFTQEMDDAISKLERYGSEFTVMFLDLDKFKLVNDTRGHLVGDQMLRLVSSRIQQTVRQGDKVARLGGDEFAVIMTQKCDAGSAARLAGQLIAEVSRPYEIEGERHSIGVSIGIAQAPINGTRPNQILRNADLALYRSKADGRGIFRFFENQMDADEREKRMLELEMNQAIENDEFELVYQPLISTETGLPSTMEALIRWHHPMRGLISPVEFIPIAEQSSLIQEIGKWSMRRACLEALKWPEDVVVAVNLSSQQFSGSDIVNITKQILEETGLAANRLELEVTESLLINNTEEVLKTLKQLKALGVQIALDDFGTGYSSLAYIMKFPFDKIKIDRSFVKACSDDEAAKAILKMISTLGESLNIKITAEGVETLEQVEFLKSINCHQFQGYLFAKPLKAESLNSYFSEEHSKLGITYLPVPQSVPERKIA